MSQVPDRPPPARNEGMPASAAAAPAGVRTEAAGGGPPVRHAMPPAGPLTQAAGEGPPARVERCRWLAPHSPWQLVAGFTLWAIWFVAVYGGLSVACAVAPPSSARGPLTGLSLGLLALTVATVALLLLAAWHCLRGLRRLRAAGPRIGGGDGNSNRNGDEEAADRHARRQFVAGLAALLHGTAAVATVFVGLPLLWLPPCL